MKNQNNNPLKRQDKGTKKGHAIKLFEALYLKPISRRMAATIIGLPDQTYMVTQLISDWIKQGRAQVIGSVRCNRSGRVVEAITTNPELFVADNDNQLTLF